MDSHPQKKRGLFRLHRGHDSTPSTRLEPVNSSRTSSTGAPAIPSRSSSLRISPSNTSAKREDTNNNGRLSRNSSIQSKTTKKPVHLDVAPNMNIGSKRARSPGIGPSRRRASTTSIASSHRSGIVGKDDTYSSILDFDFETNWIIDIVPRDDRTDEPIKPARAPTVIRRHKSSSTTRSSISRSSIRQGRNPSTVSKKGYNNQFSFVKKSGGSTLDLTRDHKRSSIQGPPLSRRASTQSNRSESNFSTFSEIAPSIASTRPSLVNTIVLQGGMEGDDDYGGVKAWKWFHNQLERARLYRVIVRIKRKEDKDITTKYDRMLEDIRLETKRILHFVKLLTHDTLQSSFTLLRSAGTWGYTFMPVAMIFLFLWDAFQLVHDNMQTCTVLMNSCASNLANTFDTISVVLDSDADLQGMLSGHLNVMREKFLAVHQFLLAQSNENALVRFICRKEIERILNNQGYRLDREINYFFHKVNLQSLKKIIRLITMVDGNTKLLEDIHKVTVGSDFKSNGKSVSNAGESVAELAITLKELKTKYNGKGIKKAIEGMYETKEPDKNNLQEPMYYIEAAQDAINSLKSLEEKGLNAVMDVPNNKEELRKTLQQVKRANRRMKRDLLELQKKKGKVVQEYEKDLQELREIHLQAQVEFCNTAEKKLNSLIDNFVPQNYLGTILAGDSEDEG